MSFSYKYKQQIKQYNAEDTFDKKNACTFLFYFWKIKKTNSEIYLFTLLFSFPFLRRKTLKRV